MTLDALVRREVGTATQAGAFSGEMKEVTSEAAGWEARWENGMLRKEQHFQDKVGSTCLWDQRRRPQRM